MHVCFAIQHYAPDRVVIGAEIVNVHLNDTCWKKQEIGYQK